MNGLRVLTAVVSAILFSATVFAQGNAGRILGTISDSSGAFIAGSTIAITDVQRGISRTLTSNVAGEFSAPDLLPGAYTVEASATGFGSVKQSGLVLEVSEDLRVDLTLRPGQHAEQIIVTGEGPLLETTTATIGGTIENKMINDLPINGRDYQKLLALRPGVMIYPGGGGWSQSADGVRPESNAYIVDGLDNTEPFSALSVINAPGLVGDAVTVIPIDAIQEFNTQINPKAEYGWKPGFIANVGLKSGTNRIHGTAYAFGRSDSFDARNYFNQAPAAKVPLDFKQYGATVGGPIKKEKLFFFFAYEAQRYTVGNSYVVSVPTSSAGAGTNMSIPDAEADLAAHGVPVNQLSLNLLPLFPANSGPSSSLTIGYPNSNSSDSYLGKIDFLINQRHTVDGMFFYGKDSETAQDQPFLSARWLSINTQKPITAGGNWIYLPNSHWVNEARIGYLRQNRINSSADANIAPTTYGINTGVTDPGRFGMPQIAIGGFNALGGGVNWPKFQGPDGLYQGRDAVSYLVKNHTIKLGGEMRYADVHEGSYRGGKGQIFFNGQQAFCPSQTDCSTQLEDFLAGTPSTGRISAGNPLRHVTQQFYAGFVQDDWRLRKNLTFNVGVRYEYSTPLKEEHNLLGNFEPGVGLEQVGSQISSPYNADHSNFAPRFGASWDPAGRGRTVVRVGGGMSYDTLSMETYLVQENTQNATTLGLGSIPTGASFVVNGATTPGKGTIAVSSVTIPCSSGPGCLNWSVAGPVFPSEAVTCGDGVGSDPSPCNLLGIDRHLKTPFVATWTLGIQQALSADLSLDMAYVGNYGARLVGIRDINQVSLATGVVPYAAQYPYLGAINILSNQYTSNYNGLQVTLTKRASHGVSGLLGYTWSHSFDYSSTNQNQFLPQDSTQPNLEYASSDYDIRHRLTVSMTYEIPAFKAPAQLLRGWEINAIGSIQTAQPWTVNDTVDNISNSNENTDRWDFFGDPSDFTSSRNPIPYFPGGSTPALCQAHADIGQLNTYGCYMKGHSVMTPPLAGTFGNMHRNLFQDSGFNSLDLSIVKMWHFGEILTAQLRAESFNILNHPTFANPYGGTSGYGPGAFDDPSSTGAFGCGCSTPDQAAGNPVVGSGSSRAIQLGLKLIF